MALDDEAQGGLAVAMRRRDFAARPGPSLVYAALVFLVSLAILGGLFAFGWDYILFPALFLSIAVLGLGLYRRRVAASCSNDAKGSS